MKNYSLIKGTAIAATLATFLSVMPVSAEMRTGMGTSTVLHRPIMATLHASSTHASSTRASSTEQRIEAGQARGENMIDQRVASLTELTARINSLKKLSDTQKAAIVAMIQAEVTSLNNLKTTIGTDNSTTTVKGDVGSITKGYRVYALVMPQIEIIAESDRLLGVVDSLNVVYTKVQTRLASTTLDASTTAALHTVLADFSAKIADATSQTNAAITLVTSLKPDNGDATIATANKAALKDARTKNSAAQKDVQDARKDIEGLTAHIVKGFVKHSDN